MQYYISVVGGQACIKNGERERCSEFCVYCTYSGEDGSVLEKDRGM